jgi:hypothetical protein
MKSVHITPQASSVVANPTPGVDRPPVGLEALKGANPLQTHRERYVRDTQGGLDVDGRIIHGHDSPRSDGGTPLDGASFARPANKYIAFLAAMLATTPARADLIDFRFEGPLGFEFWHEDHWDTNGIHVDPPQSVPEPESPIVLLTAAGAGVLMRRKRA